MLKNRLKGISYSLILIMLMIDILVYLGLVALARQDTFLSLVPSSRPFTYLLAVIAGILLIGQELYSHRSNITRMSLLEAGSISLRMSFYFAICAAFFYISLKDTAISRLFLLVYLTLYTILNAMALKVMPPLLARLIFRQNETSNNLLVLCSGAPDSLLKYLQQCRADFGLNFNGYYAETADERLDLEHRGDLTAFLDELEEMDHFSGRVLLFSNDFYQARFQSYVKRCQNLGVRLQIYSDFLDTFQGPIQITEDGGLHFFSMIEEPLENPVNQALKRALDFAVTIPVLLFILLPLIPVVWLAHRISSPGPLFYRQKRYGLNREYFTIYKFRTMHVRDSEDEDQGIQATQQDKRIFRFGAFLRKSSLDEFPQFINVFLGQMSVIGPRPHFVLHDDEFEQLFRNYRFRHFVKPGITGFAQINGLRGEIRSEDLLVRRIQHDLHYINHWSLRLDLYIILRTVWQILFPPPTAF